MRYKVVELSTVTDETLEAALNEWTAKGYDLESIQFAMRESSRRPTMAFILFRLGEGPAEGLSDGREASDPPQKANSVANQGEVEE